MHLYHKICALVAITTTIMCMLATHDASADDRQPVPALTVESWLGVNELSARYVSEFARRWNKLTSTESEDISSYFEIGSLVGEKYDKDILIEILGPLSRNASTMAYPKDTVAQERVKVWFQHFQERANKEIPYFRGMSSEDLLRHWVAAKSIEHGTFFWCFYPICDNRPPFT